MYLKISSMEENDKLFSYLLCKKPGSIYDRDYILGHYEGNQYILNSNISFSKLLPVLKERNDESYNSYPYEGVTPYFLVRIYEALRSAITGNYKSDEINVIEESKRERYLSFEIGPFLCDYGNIKEVFNSLGFNVFQVTGFGTMEVAYSLLLTCKSTLQVALQKIVMISLYSTFKNNLFKINDEQIEKYIRNCAWLESDNPHAKNIIRTLCKNNKNMEKKFIDTIMDEDDVEAKELKDSLYIDYTTLHSYRHKFIIEQVQKIISDEVLKYSELHGTFTIVDYGCANGRLSTKLNDKLKIMNEGFHIYSYDASDKVAKFFYGFKNVTFNQMNLLYPNVSMLPRSTDILILSEIIEHFDFKERKQILDSIINVINPKFIILTTPNIEYNSKFGIGEGGYRDKTHKIEFNSDEYIDQILNYFKENKYIGMSYGIQYDVNKLIEPTLKDGLLDTPSFISVFYNQNVNREGKNRYKAFSNYAPIYLPISDYVIDDRELSVGYSDRAFINNSNNIFYIAPTVPPVDYNNSENTKDYLEHPLTVQNYYRSRGITELVAEEKYMGSRAHIVLFKSDEVARDYGSDIKIIINTRNGNRFFDSNVEEDKFYSVIENQLEYDITILDTEMMPWNIKAENLIKYKFQGVGECAIINRNNGGSGIIENAEKYLSILKKYVNPYIEPYCRVFGILALGKKNNNKYEWIVGSAIDNLDKMKYIRALENNKFKCVQQYYVNLNSEISCIENINNWLEYTSMGGEGFVYKPIVTRNYQSNGYLIQPMMKVRGKDYLRLIYGLDYLEEENFNIVKNRKTKMKRLQAIQQTELSDIVLQAYIHKQFCIKRYIAGFLGSEGVSFSCVDKTL